MSIVRLAAGIIILMAIFGTIVMIAALVDSPWDFKRSPETGICYEVYRIGLPLSLIYTASPVDSSFCEGRKP